MNESPNPNDNEIQTTPPAPESSVWTIVWSLLAAVSTFMAAYFASKHNPGGIWFGLLAGVFMLLGHLSKPNKP